MGLYQGVSFSSLLILIMIRKNGELVGDDSFGPSSGLDLLSRVADILRVIPFL